MIRLFVSHTTRDKRDDLLARRIAVGLRARGAEVFLAPDSIPPGEDWNAHLVSAVLQKCTHLLVILSQASVRAEWVLRELELAFTRKRDDPAFKILPLRVGELDEYALRDAIDALQSLSFVDDVTEQVNAVAKALNLPSRPRAPMPPEPLSPAEFVGREHVFSEIEGFLATNESGYLTIVADPGAGKTALLTEFVRRTGCIAHFNSRASGCVSASAFLTSVCEQIEARYDRDETPTGQRDGRFLERLLGLVSKSVSRQNPLIVAIDALDEVEEPQILGANILFLPRSLPAGVFFIMTQRDVEVSLVSDAPLATRHLSADSKENLADIETYISRYIGENGLGSWRDANRGLSVEAATALLADLSEGNFMYLRHVLPAIARGDFAGTEVEELPRGLQAYYLSHWIRMGMQTRPTPDLKIRVIYLLAEVKLPVSRAFLAQLAGGDGDSISELQIQAILDEWREFLHSQLGESAKRYSVYHTSFRQFLHRREIVQAAGVTLSKIHGHIADRLLEELDS